MMRSGSVFAAACLSAFGVFGATAIQTALDNTSLTFTTGGDAEWFSQSSEVHAGTTALRSGAISDDGETWVETTVSGTGMVSFWWKASSESVSWDWLEVSVDGNVQDKIGGSDAGWKQKSVFTVGTGSHTIRWCYRKDGSVSEGSDCGWLDQVEWTPAPASMRVSFVVNGGSSLPSRTVYPGDLISSLPIPTSGDGRVFACWCYDAELTSRALPSDPIPFRDVTLYADWRYPVSELDDEGIAFSSEDVSWWVERGVGFGGGKAAVAEVPAGQEADLSAFVSGKGTLSFKWKVEPVDQRYASGDFTFGVDEQDYWPESWSYNRWNEESLTVVSGGGHDVRWILENWYGDGTRIRYLISDIVWIPAPETITVSFDSDGGSGVGQAVFSPGDVFGNLPVPTRTGWTFAGWRLDSVVGKEIHAEDLVPFRENVRLVARWTRSVSYLKDAGFMYSTSGDDKFDLTNVKASEGGLCAGVTLTRYYCSKLGPGAAPFATDKPVKLLTTVTGPGYLTFEWMAIEPKGTWVDGVFLLDGEEVESLADWSEDLRKDKAHVYIPSGKHAIRWEARGYPSFETTRNEDLEWEEYTLIASPSLYIGDITFEKAGPQPSPAAWMEKLDDYGVFVTGDPAKFKKTYAARIAKDPDDYEARIFHAVSMLAELAENADFKKFAKTFGYTLDYTHCAMTGTPKLDTKTAAVNTMVDKALSVGVPVLNAALADLNAIPDDWTGTIRFSADEWPVDETVELDIADIRFARASLKSATAALYFLGGYDLTVDWTKAKTEADWTPPIAKVSAIPDIDDDFAWSCIDPHLGESEDGNWTLGVECARTVICGTKIGLLIECSQPPLEPGRILSSVSTSIRSGDLKYELEYWVSASLCSEGEQPTAYWTVTKNDDWDSEIEISGSVESSGNRILVVFNCAAIPSFAKKTWCECDSDGFIETSSSERSDWRWGDWDVDTGLARFQKIILEQTKFLSKVRNASRLTTAKTQVRAALTEALAADEAAMLRAEDGILHFVEYDPADAVRQAAARENTVKALWALDGAEEFDIPELYRTFRPEGEDFDSTLLPNNGVLDLYLGALFAGKITRAMKPNTHLNGYGEMIVDTASMPDPTFGGLLPGVTSDDWNGIAEVNNPEDTLVLSREMIPGEKLRLNLSRFIGYSISGLPKKGWTWDSKTGLLSGTVSGPLNLTFKGGGMTETVRLKAAPKPVVNVAGEEIGVKAVTGSGAYAANAAVKLVAVVEKGYAFAGWYDAEEQLVSPNLSYSFKMPMTDVYLEARAIALGEDGLKLYPEEETVELDRNVPVSTEEGRYLHCESGSPYTMSATGLPTGIKLVQSADLTHYYLSGTPTKTGVYYASFNAKNNGGFKNSCVIRFVVGGAEEPETNTANIDLDGIAGTELRTGVLFEDSVDVPNSDKNGAVKKIAVSGLPKGWTAKATVREPSDCSFCRNDSYIRISGRATTAGLYTLKVTVTYKNKKTAMTVKKVIVYDSGSAYLPVQVVTGQSDRGSVSGGGVYAIGSQVKIKATSANKKKYFFAGWYCDENCLDRCTALSANGEWRNASATVPFDSDWRYDGLYARFVTKAEDAISIVCDDEWHVDPTSGCVPCGIGGRTEPLSISVESETVPTLKATTLPSGIKLSGGKLVVSKASSLKPGMQKAVLTAKNLSGNSVSKTVWVVVPNTTTAVDYGYLDLDTSNEGYDLRYSEDFRVGVKASISLEEDLGIWVAEGWTLSVSGLPSGWAYKSGKITGTATAAGPKTVTFTVTKGKKSYKATATFKLSALPDWAVGTFVGATLTTYGGWGEFEEGTVSCTVSAAGKVSGSYVMSGDASKTTFSGSGFAREDGRLVAQVKGKVDGKSKTFTLSIGEDGVSFSGKISSSESIESELLVKNPWTGPAVDRSTLPVFAADVKCSFPATGFFRGAEQEGTVTLSFSGDGKVSGKFVTKKGTVSAGLQLADFSICKSEDEWAGYLVVGIPANKSKKIAGYCSYLRFDMVRDPADGLVHKVVVEDRYGFGFFDGGYW